jgi:hypothetical protein
LEDPEVSSSSGLDVSLARSEACCSTVSLVVSCNPTATLRKDSSEPRRAAEELDEEKSSFNSAVDALSTFKYREDVQVVRY